MSDKETKKPTVDELEAEIARMQEDMKKVYQIANAYIKAHRDLLTQIRTAHDTSANLETLLAEKLK